VHALGDLDGDGFDDIALGDLDGDGFDDIALFGTTATGDDLSWSDPWPLATIVPGSTDLGLPVPGLTSFDDESRPPVRLGLVTRDDLRSVWFDVTLGDLDGDGQPELLLHAPATYAWEVHDAGGLLQLDGDVTLSEAGVLAGMLVVDPADPLNGTCVWFGDGTIGSFDRLPDEVDLLIPGTGSPQLTPPRSGGAGDDIAFFGGRHRASVLPSQLLADGADRR